jgi:hypothetical protein
MKELEELLSKVNESLEGTEPLIAVLLVIAGILLLYQFLIVIIGPACIFIGGWYLWNLKNESKESN